jgi:putative ATP-dependent endonuclease of the OLD family
MPSPAQPERIQFRVGVSDHDLDTQVERQGHGFQRAFVIAALKLLADTGRDHESPGVICLAIEEPELYQHPLQARVFASVLR